MSLLLGDVFGILLCCKFVIVEGVVVFKVLGERVKMREERRTEYI